MQTLAAKWPDSVPAIWSGFSIGIAAPYPRQSIAEDFDYVPHHIVKEAYLLHSGRNDDRPTWDLTSVLYSVFPEREFFDLSVPGRVTVEEDGFTHVAPREGVEWTGKTQKTVTKEKARDRYLKMSPLQAARVQEALVHQVAAPPGDASPARR
ncbi:MAG: hypothetical protein P1U87_22005 [Verrucomicrobiales bacterium]|nr:hypothetical protein [Verrucomicrobiales bacterium]